MEIPIPKVSLPLSFDKEYHLGFIYHASSLDWVKITTTKLEQEQNLICYFRDRNGLPGDRKPELDPDGNFFRKVMNFVVVLNNQFLNDRQCMNLLSLSKQASLEDQRCNVLPVLLDGCEIPFLLCDTTIIEIQECEESGWYNRLLGAIQLDERPSVDIMKLEKASSSLVEAFESEELGEVLHSLGDPIARKIDFCLTQGRSSETYEGLKFLATNKWFRTIFFCSPDDISMVNRIIKSLNKTVSQPLQGHMTEQLYIGLHNYLTQGSIDVEYDDFHEVVVTLCAKKSNHPSNNKLAHNDRKPYWNRSLNVVLVLSKNSTRDRGFLQKIDQILMAHVEAHDNESFKIIPLKIDNCEVPYNLRGVFDVKILDEKKEFIMKFYHAISGTVNSDKLFFKESHKRNKTESSLKTLSSVLAKTPRDQLSDFLSKPVATKLRHYFAEYGEIRYWKLAMESCGITLSGRTVVIRLKPLIRHLCLGHVVGKYYDYCKSLSGENLINMENKKSVYTVSFDNDSLVIESYGSQPCDSFVIGVGLQHALDFSYSNDKMSNKLIRQWLKGTSCKLGKCFISIYCSKKQSNNHREMRMNAYPLFRQILSSVNTENFCFAILDLLNRYENKVSLECDVNFEKDMEEIIGSDSQELDVLRCDDEKLAVTKLTLVPSGNCRANVNFHSLWTRAPPFKDD